MTARPRARGVVAAVALAGCVPAAGPPLPGLMSGDTVARTADIAVSDAVAAAGRDFAAERKPFGAMYVTADGRGWGWNTGFSTLAEAERAARVLCEVDGPAPCRRYMTSVPDGTPDGTQLSAGHRALLSEAIERTEPGRYAAIAVSGTGSAGSGWNWETEEAAMDAALAQCDAGDAAERADQPMAVRRAFDAAGLFRCRPLRAFRG